MATYKNLDELQNALGVKIMTREMKAYEVKNHPELGTRYSQNPPRDAINTRPAGSEYSVEYNDKEGTHRAGLDGYLQRNPTVQITEMPVGYEQYQTTRGLAVPANFTSRTASAVQGAKAYSVFGAQGAVSPAQQSIASQIIPQNPNDLIWVKKGSNTLQMTRVAAQSQGLLEVTTQTTAPGTPGDQNGAVAGSTGQVAQQPSKGLPETITSADWFKNLTSDQQQYLTYTYNTITSVNSADQEANKKALEEAMKLADPYSKQQISMALDEVTRVMGGTSQDLSSAVGSLHTKVDQIKKDLAYNKEQLSLEQQADMSQLMRNYQSQLGNLQTQMVESGLAFSSPRKEAERRLAEEQGAMGQALSRRTAQSLRELETGSLRNIQSTSQQIADTSRQGAEKLTDIYRSAEQTLGTKNLPTFGGVNPLGNITGSIEENRQSAILGLEDTLREKENALTL